MFVEFRYQFGVNYIGSLVQKHISHSISYRLDRGIAACDFELVVFDARMLNRSCVMCSV